MKYGLIVLVLMVSLRLVHGAESLEREEPAHPADATAVAVKDDSLRTYTNNQYFQSPEELRAFFCRSNRFRSYGISKFRITK